MKKLSLCAVALLLTAFSVLGQGVKIQAFTTNSGPVVSNIVISLSSNLLPNRLLSTNTITGVRVFAATNGSAAGFWLDPATITPGQATNVISVAAGTGITIVTNVLLRTISTPAVTNNETRQITFQGAATLKDGSDNSLLAGQRKLVTGASVDLDWFNHILNHTEAANDSWLGSAERMTNAPVSILRIADGTPLTNGAAGQALLSLGNGGVVWGTAAVAGGDGAALTNLNVYYLNVLDFNANTNLADNSSKIQAAMDYGRSRGIKSVYVPTGIYACTNAIYIPRGMELFGAQGSVEFDSAPRPSSKSSSWLVFSNNTSGIIITNCNQVIVKHLALLANYTNFATCGIALSNGIPSSAGDAGFPGEDVQVLNNDIRGFGWGYVSTSPTRVKVRGNDIKGVRSGAVLLQGLIDTTEFEQNLFCGGRFDQNDGTFGPLFTIPNTVNTGCRNLMIANNELGDSNPTIYCPAQGIQYITVVNNGIERLFAGTNFFVIGGFVNMILDNNRFQGDNPAGGNTNALVRCINDGGGRLVQMRGPRGGLTNWAGTDKPFLFHGAATDEDQFVSTVPGVTEYDTVSDMFYSSQWIRDINLSSVVSTNVSTRGRIYRELNFDFTPDRLKFDGWNGSGYVRRTLAFTDEITGVTVPGNDTEIIFNRSGSFGATNKFYYDDSIAKTTSDGVMLVVGTTEGANYNRLTLISNPNGSSSSLGLQVTESGVTDVKNFWLMPYGGTVRIGAAVSAGGVITGNGSGLTNIPVATGLASGGTFPVENAVNLTNYGGIKIYRALISQSGTSAPTESSVGQNTIGATTWGYTAVGNYTLTITGGFTSGKTFAQIQNNRAITDTDDGSYSISRVDANTINVRTRYTGSGGPNLSNNMMTDTFVEVLVYP